MPTDMPSPPLICRSSLLSPHCPSLSPLPRPAAPATIDNCYVPDVEVVGDIANSIKCLTPLLEVWFSH